MTESIFTNLDMKDRGVRFATGAVLIGAVMSMPSLPAWLALVAPYPVVTAIMGWDPVYALKQQVHAPKVLHLSRLKNKTA